MSALYQIDAGYNQREDRISLRLTNTNKEEFRFWLTRRVCAALLTDFKTRTSAYRISAMEAGLTKAATPDSPVSTESKPADAADQPDQETVLMAALEQKAAVAQQDFSSEFQAGQAFPQGEDGILVEQINLIPNAQGQDTHSLCFANAKGIGITLGVGTDVLNTFFEIIERAVQRTDWNVMPATLEVQASKLLQ